MSDRLASAIVDQSARKEINDRIEWRYRNYGDLLRTDVPVSNAYRLPLAVVVQVPRSKPWGPTLILLHRTSGANVRRLDVRGGHVNTLTDRREWRFRTHLHVWRERYGTSHAEESSLGMSHDDERFPDVPAEEYRQLFEEFCRMCGITLGDGYEWSEPPPFGEEEVTLGGEIP